MCCKSSFDGIIHEIPGISVDNFKIGSVAYFLSHCHTDHTQGLYSPSFLEFLENKPNIFIYTSKISTAIVEHEANDKTISKYLKPLEIGKSVITLPKDETNNIDEQYLTITVLPAAHCFGSLIFLFQTMYKTIMYTGDFRISSSDVTRYAHFHDSNGDVIPLDVMYLDTTFQDHKYNDFPKRSKSVEYVIDEIKKWLSLRESNRVVLRTSAKYGYEFIFNEIYKSLKLKVYVDELKWKLYSQFPEQVYGVTDSKDSKIHLARYVCNQDNTLNIHFSAMRWSYYDLNENLLEKINNKIEVCFPTHCSRNELVFFVNYFNPKQVIGFPVPYKCEDETKSLKRKCDETFKTDVLCNNDSSKGSFKVDPELVKEIFGC